METSIFDELVFSVDFKFGFAVDLMIKDLKIALKHSKSLDLNLDTSKKVLNKYNQLSELGFGNLDTSSLMKLLSKTKI